MTWSGCWPLSRRCKYRRQDLPSRDGADNEQWLLPRRDRVGERGIRRLMREVLLTGEKSQKRPPLLRDVVPDRSPEHGIARLECIEDRAHCNPTRDVELHFCLHPRQCPEVIGQGHAYHCSVCTSTDSTAGRSRTIAVQLSPASAEA